MSNLLQPVHHPDADRLSAFAERALPAHEQQQTLAHLATCPDCRAIVFLAQQAIPAEAPHPAPRPWFSTWNLAWAATAAFACALLVTVGLHRAAAPKPTPTVATSAAVEQPAPSPAAPALSQSVLDKSQSAPQESHAVPPKPTPPVPTNPPPRSLAQTKLAVVPLGGVPAQDVPALRNPAVGISSARGAATRTVTIGSVPPPSPNQQFIAGASVGTRSIQGDSIPVRGAASDSAAADQFSADRLSANPASASSATPVASPIVAGQLSQRQAVTLSQAQTHTGPSQVQSQQPYQLAAAPPPPRPLAAAPAAGLARANQTVSVENASSIAPQPSTSSAVVSGAALNQVAAPQAQPANALAVKSLLALPSHLLTVSTVSRASQTLAIDTAGTLYLSKDSGKSWQPVPPQWTGHAAKVALVPSISAFAGAPQKSALQKKAANASQPAFELTTASGSIFTSSDGEHWRLK